MLLHFKCQEPTVAYVYILTNDNNTVLYTGFTDTLAKRILVPTKGITVQGIFAQHFLPIFAK